MRNRHAHFETARQSGISLVLVTFFVVVVALSMVFMARLVGFQQATTNLAIESARARQAAQAGIQWALYRAMVNNLCSNSSFNLSEADLSGFAVSVTCSQQDYSEGTNTVSVYEITASASKGTYGTSPDYVFRRLAVTAYKES